MLFNCFRRLDTDKLVGRSNTYTLRLRLDVEQADLLIFLSDDDDGEKKQMWRSRKSTISPSPSATRPDLEC